MKYLAICFLSAAVAFLTSCGDSRHVMRVSTADQRMALYRDGELIKTYRVSTSKFGIGDEPGSNRTPLGRFVIAQKIGKGQPLGMKFKARRPTGEIVPVNAPGRDPIVTRIIRIRGVEPWNKNAYSRCIYIHGTPEEHKLGSPASYGCVRMASKDVRDLYDRIGKKARVEIYALPLNGLAEPKG
jgi:hypothetical protein